MWLRAVWLRAMWLRASGRRPWQPRLAARAKVDRASCPAAHEERMSRTLRTLHSLHLGAAAGGTQPRHATTRRVATSCHMTTFGISFYCFCVVGATPPGNPSASANLRPDPAAGILNVELHGQANPINDAIVAHICEELNTTETTYPGTNLRLKFTPIRSSAFPAGQDV